MTYRAVPNTNPNTNTNEVATKPNSATFQINNVKLYVPVVTLSINYNIKFLENLKDLKEQFLGTNIDLK